MRTVCAGIAAAMISACGVSSDVLDETYPALEDAKRDGAVERGWIPAWLPTSMTYIQESHNVDTNVSIMTARYRPSENWSIPSECVRIGASPVERAPINRS